MTWLPVAAGNSNVTEGEFSRDILPEILNTLQTSLSWDWTIISTWTHRPSQSLSTDIQEKPISAPYGETEEEIMLWVSLS